jgi:uncharacterized membrane protein
MVTIFLFSNLAIINILVLIIVQRVFDIVAHFATTNILILIIVQGVFDIVADVARSHHFVTITNIC